MTYQLPAAVKQAERLLLEVETAVRRWTRYHKYTHGAELRSRAFNVAQLAHRAWNDRENRAEWIRRLAFGIDDLKLTLQLAKQLEAFVSFAQFENLARIASELGRQCGGWQKQQRVRGQNDSTPQALSQRVKTLSARGASPEAC
jgi:hypothetical protein